MKALSKRARKQLQRIGSASGRGPARFHRDGNGRFYLPDGKEISGSAFHELLDSGVFAPCEDGLFPGFTQTFTIVTENVV